MPLFESITPYFWPSVGQLEKHECLDTVLELRTTKREYLARAKGEATDATQGTERHVLFRQGDGRYLFIPALTCDEIKEVLATSLAPSTKRRLGCEEFRNEVANLLEVEMEAYGYSKFLKNGEEVATMSFEAKVSCYPLGVSYNKQRSWSLKILKMT